ncbi:hypothetical protein FNV43_RR07755 [Rhamnella rubrinervis]|uniref:Uncharacterized protein n=1 Tax=Rhamnella rubrinervis TaxID=2594499 RepID=A0A8K0HGC4_9ROSA|nr:hypothetical protein FNV43_RR07755 [Rhamnella rubrinervis]
MLLVDINELKQETLQGLTGRDRAHGKTMSATETPQRRWWKVFETWLVEDEISDSSGRAKYRDYPSNTRSHDSSVDLGAKVPRS